MLMKRKIIFICGIITILSLFLGGVLLNSHSYAAQKEVKLLVYPEKYALTMSNTPGIQIYVNKLAHGEKVRYLAEKGALSTWGPPDYKILNNVSMIELNNNTPVYWLPCRADGEISEEKKNRVIITIFDHKGKQIVKKKLIILYDGSMYYNVKLTDDILFKIVRKEDFKQQLSK